ncbi:hypothetical protein NL676_004728 [Syzygium grande]|nr:hypothetical protein NL676_004728 [Syzygium grande]
MWRLESEAEVMVLFAMEVEGDAIAVDEAWVLACHVGIVAAYSHFAIEIFSILGETSHSKFQLRSSDFRTKLVLSRWTSTGAALLQYKALRITPILASHSPLPILHLMEVEEDITVGGALGGKEQPLGGGTLVGRAFRGVDPLLVGGSVAVRGHWDG